MQTIGHCMHYTGFEPVDRNLKKGGGRIFEGGLIFGRLWYFRLLKYLNQEVVEEVILVCILLMY